MQDIPPLHTAARCSFLSLNGRWPPSQRSDWHHHPHTPPPRTRSQRAPNTHRPSPKPLSLPSLTLLPSGPARLSQHKSSAVGQMVNSALDNGCDWHHHRGAHGSQQQQEVVEDSENEGATQSKSPGPSMRSVHRVAQGCARITPSNRQRNEKRKKNRINERERERHRARAAHRIRRQRGR